VISPYAPHIAEELWSILGHEGSIALVPFPAKYLVESEKEYPVSFNEKCVLRLLCLGFNQRTN
jgi:leucyl-tRNA synthetase